MAPMMLLLLVFLLKNECLATLASPIPGFFVFGDSSVDTGNNNFITTLIKANSLPYGMNFDPPGATGRFSNGKLFLDLPYPVNFLDSSVSPLEHLNGVNFAAAGAGFLDSTGFSPGVRSFSKQIKEFQRVVKTSEALIGKGTMLELLSQSIFLVSFAGNDFAANYQLNPFKRLFYNFTQFESFLVNQISNSIQVLNAYGARKFIISDIPPVGCTPVELSLHGAVNGECIESVNYPIRRFNRKISLLLTKLRNIYKDCDFLHLRSYTIVKDILKDHKAYGLKQTSKACCGNGGHYNALGICNWLLSSICKNPDEYAFWDMVHPTKAVYKIVASKAILGPPKYIYPRNIASLVNENHVLDM